MGAFLNETVSFRGRVVFGLEDFSAWPGDLLSFRQEWEPFIQAHLNLWRYLNALFEGTEEAQTKCPPGIFSEAQIATLEPTTRGFCASLAMTRRRISDVDSGGILTQWDAWRDKSSSEILVGAAPMLKWHQDVVASVGGPYKDELLEIAKLWNVQIDLPELPTFDKQQDIIARIEGAYISTKGILQIAGYGAGQTLMFAGDKAQAVAQSLTDTLKSVPALVNRVDPTTVILGAVMVAAIAGGVYLYIYHPPRRQKEAA